MKREFCGTCGRETLRGLPDRASVRRVNASCKRDPSVGSSAIAITDCAGFAAGRRAAFKEADAFVRGWWNEDGKNLSPLLAKFRAAMKPRLK